MYNFSYYCTVGSTSAKQNMCGSPGVYCPEGSWEPTIATEGFYVIHTGVNAGALDLLDTGKQLGSAEIACEPGWWCSGGLKKPCPPGTFGWRYGLNSSYCSGKCSAGFYCPSILDPSEVPDGMFASNVSPHERFLKIMFLLSAELHSMADGSSSISCGL